MTRMPVLDEYTWWWNTCHGGMGSPSHLQANWSLYLQTPKREYGWSGV